MCQYLGLGQKYGYPQFESLKFKTEVASGVQAVGLGMFTSLPSLDPRTVSRGHLRLKKVDNHMFLCVFELKTWDTWVCPHFCPLIHWLFQMCRSLDLFKCRSRSQAFGLLEPGRNSDIGWHDRVSLKPIYHDLPMILCTLRETPGCVWGFSRFPAPALDWWNWKRSKWEAYGRVLHGSVFGSSIDVPCIPT